MKLRTVVDGRRTVTDETSASTATGIDPVEREDLDGEALDHTRAERPSGLSWPKVIATVAAFCWLAGAIGWVSGQRDSNPSRDSVEAGFYQDMIVHHEQARTMALMELERGSDPTVLAFAQEIIIFQQYEIGLMDQSLAGWGQGRVDRQADAMSWMGMSVNPDRMPGMASPEQLDEFNGLSGAEADAKFLELMSEHHRGGVHMASFARQNASDPGVRRLAARMERNQAVEVNEYAQTAERLGFDVDIELMDVPDL